MADSRNSSADEEAFQKHLKEMLARDADGPTNGHSSGQGYTTAMSNVDLNGPSPPSLTTSTSYDLNESPFKAPPAEFNQKSAMPGSQSNPAGLSASGAYPRPPPQGTAGSKVDQIKTQVKEFTVETFRTTRQLVSEILGKGTKTVDPQIDNAASVCQVTDEWTVKCRDDNVLTQQLYWHLQCIVATTNYLLALEPHSAVADLRVLQATYQRLLEETNSMHGYLSNVIYTQKQMTNTLAELSQRDPSLAEDFNCNAETQKVLIKNGEQLLGALQFFLSNMRTMCHKTMQDCLDTVKKYEAARLQYDTYRNENEQAIHSGAAATARTADIKQKYEERKRKYEQLKADLVVKMQFLNENKTKVVHRQMVLFHNAMSAYFTGNQQQLQAIMSQFSVKLKTPNTAPPSWLEQ